MSVGFQAIMSGNLVVIDADPGVDDALAILMATSKHTRHLVNLLAITTVRGNVDIDQICLNALRVLQVADRLDVRYVKFSEALDRKSRAISSVRVDRSTA